jgi:aminomuconate-semialdehyde/2-hydroxymuconate-6-semialdehyde dehydrogenase
MAQKQILNFINGEFVSAKSGKTFENVSPVDGSLVGMVSEAGKEEVDAAVKAARAALEGPWAAMDIAKRSELLYAVADEINRRFKDFLDAEVADTGKPHILASHIDIPRGAANFKIFADVVKNVPTESFQMTTPDGGAAFNYAIRVPKGVIAVVAPWNLPLLLMTWKVGPALACGNTVVVKPSEETPSTATLLGEVMNKVGIPKGVYNVVHGFGPNSAGEFLTRHPGVNAITFTGETRTGTAIMKAAAEKTRAVSMELGGKNAGIVFADADFDAAVDGIARASFANTGQICLGTERVYVERKIFDKFVPALVKAAQKMKIGRPEAEGTQLGPLISHEHRNKVLSYMKKAVDEGAKVWTGGKIPDMGKELEKGAWIEPTIWTGLPETATVVQEEIFGPCCHIQPFDTEADAIRMANDTPYGLATTVWTSNLGRHIAVPLIDVGLLDQQLVPARPAHRVRRLQGFGHRPRRRRAFARVLYRVAKRVREARSRQGRAGRAPRVRCRGGLGSRARKGNRGSPQMTGGGIVATALVAHVPTLDIARTRRTTSKRWCRQKCVWGRPCAPPSNLTCGSSSRRIGCRRSTGFRRARPNTRGCASRRRRPISSRVCPTSIRVIRSSAPHSSMPGTLPASLRCATRPRITAGTTARSCRSSISIRTAKWLSSACRSC